MGTPAEKARPDSCGGHAQHELHVRALRVGYAQTTVLDGVDFQTHCGQCLALLGPNGAGKSTLLKTLAGLLIPASGEILWRGQPLSRSTSEIAYLAQRSQFDWHFPLTVRGLVEMGRFPHLGWWRPFRKSDHEIVDQALEIMSLKDLATRQIGTLSGGQQQRAFLARALAQQAHVLLLDEPFTGLDRPSQETLSQLVRHLATLGKLLIAAHHDLTNVAQIFDQALLLNRRVIAFGPITETLGEAPLAACFQGTPPLPAPPSA
ncbi:MAG: ABC transporter ATP-binding protein [Verrucomicrobiota bacterium]